MKPNMKTWWVTRARSRYFTRTGRLQWPTLAPRKRIGSLTRFMQLSPHILISRVYVPKSYPKHGRRVRAVR